MHQLERSGVFTYVTNEHTHTHMVHAYAQEEVCVHNISRCDMGNKVERI